MPNDECFLFVAEITENNDLCAQVRFDLHGVENAEISITVASEYRGKGIGKWLIKKGIEKICIDDPRLNHITAYIRPFNIASKKLFERCGFEYNTLEKIKDNILAEKWILKL